MKKKILYIAISSQTGGVPKHILDALNYAQNQEYEVAVAVPSDGDYFTWFQELAVNMLDIPLKPYSFISLWKIRNYVRKYDIELIHSHGKGAGMYARPLKILCPGVKIVHTFHGIYLESYGAFVRKIYSVIEHILKNWTDRFICVSESERTEAMRLGFASAERTNVICNGVDPEPFMAATVNRTVYLEGFGFPPDSYVVGCVARLEFMKGHRYLLEAFAELVKTYPQCRLLLVGDGPDREQIENQIKNLALDCSVCIAGIRHDVPNLLKLFDIFVSASLKEGMPYTLIEALASGVPVVATDVIGNRDIIREGENGLLVRPEDSQDMGETMKKAYENPELLKRYSIAGQRCVKEFFSSDKSMSQLFGVYGNLIGEK